MPRDPRANGTSLTSLNSHGRSRCTMPRARTIPTLPRRAGRPIGPRPGDPSRAGPRDQWPRRRGSRRSRFTRRCTTARRTAARTTRRSCSMPSVSRGLRPLGDSRAPPLAPSRAFDVAVNGLARAAAPHKAAPRLPPDSPLRDPPGESGSLRAETACARNGRQNKRLRVVTAGRRAPMTRAICANDTGSVRQ